MVANTYFGGHFSCWLANTSLVLPQEGQKRKESSKEDTKSGEVTFVDILNELREIRLEMRDLRGDLRVTIWQAAVTIIIAVVGLAVAFLS